MSGGLDFADQVRRVTRPYSHQDNWGVDVISLPMLDMLIGWLEEGVPYSDIVAHADHTTKDCTKRCEFDKETY